MAELLNRARLDADYDDTTPMWLETELTIEMVDITMVKTADHALWADGPLTYTITITNTDTSPITNLVFRDTLEFDKVAFVDGSVAVNGVTTTDYTYDQATGVLTVNLDDLAAGGSLAITFRVTKI